MTVDPHAHLRLARPCRDLAAAEQFYVDGLGLDVLCRVAAAAPGEHDLLMVGWRSAGWHLELVRVDREIRIDPDDLLVLYLAGPVDDALAARLEAVGGTRVTGGPYWDRWGVTLTDPDGHRLVLSTRDWSNAG